MFKINMMKAIKITLGCCLAFITANALHLEYSTSVVTITLLSILNTKRDTFNCCVETFCCISACLFHRHYLIYNLSVFCLGTGRLFDNNRHSLSGI